MRKSEERESALAKAVGLELEGTFEQRRTGWVKEEDKPACFERVWGGGTDISSVRLLTTNPKMEASSAQAPSRAAFSRFMESLPSTF